MSLAIAHGVLVALGIYLGVGAIVAVPLLVVGLPRIDPGVKPAPWTFRLLVLPGVVALWPVLLRRAMKAGRIS